MDLGPSRRRDRQNACPLGDPDETRHRPHTEFVHHPAAVQLDRLFRRSKVPCNPLVEAAGHDVGQHFSLARRQPGKTIIDSGQSTARGDRLRLLLCGQRNCRQQLLRFYRRSLNSVPRWTKVHLDV